MGNYNKQKYNNNNNSYNNSNNSQQNTKYSQAYRYGYVDDDDNSGPAPVIKPSGTKISFGDDDNEDYNTPVNYDNNFEDTSNNRYSNKSYNNDYNDNNYDNSYSNNNYDNNYDNSNYDNNKWGNNKYDNYSSYNGNNKHDNDYSNRNYKDNKKDFKSKKEGYNNNNAGSFNRYDNNNAGNFNRYDNNNNAGNFNKYDNNANTNQQESNSKYSTAYRYGFGGDDDAPAPVIKPSGKKMTFGSDDEEVDESEILPERKEEEKPKLIQNQFETKKKPLDTKDRKGKRAKFAHDEELEENEEETKPEEDDTNKPTLFAYNPLHDQNEEDEATEKLKDKNLGLPDWLAHPTLISPQSYTPIESYESLIGSDLTKKCLKLGFTELFPVQTAILPKLCKTQSLLLPDGDICVSAPTGSGKTLAYSLPLVWSLKERKIIRLRALVILPTRELVKQTVTLLRQLSQGTDLKTLGITGQDDLLTEQKLLVKDPNSEIIGDASLIDILVTTPGRLVTHLKSTKNFTLNHLEYLIVDEADRLLNQSYFDWLANVLSNLSKRPHPLTQDPHQLFLHNNQTPKKLLFSATLTRNPGKINQLKLFNPEYFKVASSTGERYPTPAKLKEFMVLCQKSDKPLSLVNYLVNNRTAKALCFTKSVESGTQLLQLLQHLKAKLDLPGFNHLELDNYSSELSAKQRQEILKKFQQGRINLLICSDLASRGLDLGSDLDLVINYDAPNYIKNYIHRVGRTARGGNSGNAVSFIEQGQRVFFKGIMEKAGRMELISEVKLDKEGMKSLRKEYESVLNDLDLSDNEDDEDEKENVKEEEINEDLPVTKDNETEAIKPNSGPFSWLEFTKINLKA